jgi:hypothetical protein
MQILQIDGYSRQWGQIDRSKLSIDGNCIQFEGYLIKTDGRQMDTDDRETLKIECHCRKRYALDILQL